MPEEVAATLMSHLPPAGWSDVALKSDIDDLRERVDRLEVKIDNLASMKRYVVTTGLTLAGLITGFGFAILGAVT